MTRRELIQELLAIPYGDLDTEVKLSVDSYGHAIERISYNVIEKVIEVESVYDCKEYSVDVRTE